MSNIDFSKLCPIDYMSAEDAEEKRELEKLYAEGRTFLSSFKWCGGIKQAYFGDGLGGVVGVFLFEQLPAKDNVESFLWVIVGDIPPAYIVTEDAPNPTRALAIYISMMREWVDAVKAGKSVAELIPVNAPPTLGNAKDLESRLKFLEEEVLNTEAPPKGSYH